jgi:predicted aspartyl protease
MAREYGKVSLLFLLAAIASGQGPSPSNPKAALPELRIAPPSVAKTLSFSLGKGIGRGDLAVIPITIAGKDHLFVVDTGSPGVVIDDKLADSLRALLGPPISTVSIRAAQGKAVPLKIFNAPPFEAQGVQLTNHFGNLASTDLEIVRVSLGRPVEGILGMHVLGNYVVRLDFQRGVLELADPRGFEPPGDAKAQRFPLLDAQGTPSIMLSAAGLDLTQMRIDTGGDFVLSLTDECLDKVPGSHLQKLPIQTADLAGSSPSWVVLSSPEWKIGNTSYQNTWVQEAKVNAIGLRALSDFAVTFDFPAGVLYLESISAKHRWEEPKPRLGIGFKDDKPVVMVADAELPDVEVGDEIIAIEGKKVQGIELWELREEIRSHQSATLTFRHNGADITRRLSPRKILQ